MNTFPCWPPQDFTHLWSGATSESEGVGPRLFLELGWIDAKGVLGRAINWWGDPQSGQSWDSRSLWNGLEILIWVMNR